MKYLMILIVFFSVFWVNAQGYTPEFESDECPFFMQTMADDAGASIACGYLYVPENRNDVDNSFELELFVVRLESRNQTDTAPIIYLEGGPGGAASAGATGWLESRILDDYDLIFIDQRGTGLSYPLLNCFESDFEDDWVESCRDRLVEEGIDLDMYNSATNAQDIQDLLIALDIEEANLYGSSYGTRLALTVMRDQPERIRSVMIDAVYPPQVDGLVEQVFFGNQAFEQLFTDCANDSACNSAYPDLRGTFYQTIADMNATPAQLAEEEDFIVEINGDDFANQVFSLLYDTTYLPYLPALIAAYSEGDYEYEPLDEHASEIIEESTNNDEIVADEIDELAMVQLGYDDVNDLYDYYSSISESEFDDLMFELEDLLYYQPFIDYLELDSIDAVYDYLDNIDEDEYIDLEAWVIGAYDDDSEGMFFSVECAEEIPFYTADDVIARGADTPQEINDALLESVLTGFDDCDVWDVARADDLETQAVESDIPTLIFSGSYDPVTPPDWGDAAAEFLSNSQHYIFPNVGHGALDTQTCSTDIALEFLHNPMQTVDSSCLADVSPPEFYIRG